MKKTIETVIKEKILVLDGGMATMLQKFRTTERDFIGDRFKDHPQKLDGLYEILNITKPEIVKDVHEKYAKAGADILSTNTFRANRIELAKYGLADIAYEVNYNAATAAREKTTKYTNITRSKPRYVAGILGPINPEEASLDEMQEAYSEQIKGLLAGKVDVILMETIQYEDNIKAALLALEAILKRRRKNFPMIISSAAMPNKAPFVTGELANRYTSFVHHVRILAIGMNCGEGPEQLLDMLKSLSYSSEFNIIAYPSAGVPDKNGKYSTDDKRLIEVMQKFIDKDLVNIIGGCCGVTPEHIAHIAKMTKGVKPRKF